MAKPFPVTCPNCDARLKIQNPKAIGKKVRCPHCQNPFQVNAPAPSVSRGARDDFDLDDEYDDGYDDGGYDDGGYDDEYGDDYGRQDSGSRQRSSGRSRSSSRSKPPARKKGSSNNKPMIIGAAVLGLLLLVGLGFLIYNMMGGSSEKELADANAAKLVETLGDDAAKKLTDALGRDAAGDMGWLPEETQMVISVDMDEVWNSPVGQKLRNHPQISPGSTAPRVPTGATWAAAWCAACSTRPAASPTRTTPPEAQAARRISGFADLDGLEFVAKIDVGTDTNGEDKNEIRSAVTPDHKEYAAGHGDGGTAGGNAAPGHATSTAPAQQPANPPQPTRCPRAALGAVRATAMLLRPRQKHFVERSLRALDEHGNTLGVAPTGPARPSCSRRSPAHDRRNPKAATPRPACSPIATS